MIYVARKLFVRLRLSLRIGVTVSVERHGMHHKNSPASTIGMTLAT